MTGDLTFFKTNAVNYYGVFCEGYDKANPYADLLSNVRKKYFETHSRQKDKIIKNIDGVQYRCQYTLDEDRPLKWKVYTDTQVLEKVTVASDERYFVEVRDLHNTLKKRIFFGCYHNWEKTQFFKDGETEPNVELAAWDFNNVSVILKYRRNVQRPDVLYPCAATDDEDMLQKITEKTGTPEVASMCSMGYVYFAPKEMSREWNALCEQYKRDPTLYRVPQSSKARSEKENNSKKSVTVTPVRAASKTTDTLLKKRRIDLRDTQAVIVPEKRRQETVVISSSPTARIGSEDNITAEDTPIRSRRLSGNTAQISLTDTRESDAEKKDSISEQSAQENLSPGEQGTDSSSVSATPSYISSASKHATARIPKLHSDLLMSYSDSINGKEESIISHDTHTDTDDAPDEYIIKAAAEPFVTDEHSDDETVAADEYLSDDDKPATVSDEDDTEESDEYRDIPTQSLVERAQDNTIEKVKNAYSMKKVQTATDNPRKMVPVDKVIRVSDNEQYLYFGELKSGRRNGRGRTMMKNGCTAYEGGYLDDKRDGFGVYYYKTGKICYVGDWKSNRRNGVGVAFQPSDRSMYVGGWDNDCPIGMGAKFDSTGNLSFAGRWESGSREGAGMMYDPQDGSIFVSCWENDVLSDKGTKFDSQGNLIYSGSWHKGKRSGRGTQYDKRGLVLYTGTWKDDKYDGKGTLYLSGGYRIEGEFSGGKVNGYAVAVNKHGGSLYEGQWRDNRYHGEGKLYMADGSYCQGNFEQGEPVGILSGYSADGTLLYTGEWRGGRFHGKGICYADGEKVYEGELKSGKRYGSGHEYSDGRCVYIGSFEDNMRCGFGTSYDESGSIVYSGLWENGVYDGCGLLYVSGEPRYVGQFSGGVLHGRVNEIYGGKVIRECIYSEGDCIYMREYTDDALTLKYDGNIKNGMYEGMGCSFSPYGEKYFEGIFKRNEPFKNMKVSLRKLAPLAYSEEAADSDYNRYIKGPDYVVEQEYGGGVYSGLLSGGKPEGKGTILYVDHGYTGDFKDGNACGTGVIYEWDGSEIMGTFVQEANAETTEITLANGVTYHLLTVGG